MNIPFENLEKITDIYNLLISLKEEKATAVTKRWLNSEELYAYQPYKESSIKKLIKKEELIEGKHFYQKNRIKIYDRLAIDDYIMGIDEYKQGQSSTLTADAIVNQILKCA